MDSEPIALQVANLFFSACATVAARDGLPGHIHALCIVVSDGANVSVASSSNGDELQFLLQAALDAAPALKKQSAGVMQ